MPVTPLTYVLYPVYEATCHGVTPCVWSNMSWCVYETSYHGLRRLNVVSWWCHQTETKYLDGVTSILMKFKYLDEIHPSGWIKYVDRIVRHAYMYECIYASMLMRLHKMLMTLRNMHACMHASRMRVRSYASVTSNMYTWMSQYNTQ